MSLLMMDHGGSNCMTDGTRDGALAVFYFFLVLSDTTDSQQCQIGDWHLSFKKM